MDYYRTLNLEREPFSNSPDPGLFFNSKQHLEALQKLEISLRLKRGLNIITGSVGTGKTTLCRQLIQKIAYDKTLKYFLILDPGFNSTTDFLCCLLNLFSGKPVNPEDDTALKEKIKKYLFLQGVDNHITTVLLVDEGQKLPLFCLEMLRELLNYETNDYKLLQIIIFAQEEFSGNILGLENFNDRISFRYCLSPLGFSETKALINFRLKKTAAPGSDIPGFSFFAYVAIYNVTKGFPRKIINLCHHIMLGMIIKNKTKADYFFVKSCAKEVFPSPRQRFSFVPAAVLLIILGGCVVLFNMNKMPAISSTSRKPIPAPEEKPMEFVIQTPLPTIEPSAVSLAEFEPAPETNLDIPPQPEEKPRPIIELPDIYGCLRAPKDGTLCNMIEAVYGSFKNEYLDKVLESNLNIKNPDQINAGMMIYFPIIKSAMNSWEMENICIVFLKETDFENAFSALRKYKRMGIDVRLLPAWDNRNGFLFSVVLNKPFQTLSHANDFKKTLVGINDAVCEKIFCIQ